MNEEDFRSLEEVKEIAKSFECTTEEFLYKCSIDCLKENHQLKEELERLKQPSIFIDTQDMEERYGEELYKEYLETENKQLKDRIEKAIKYMDNTFNISSMKEFIEILNNIEEILKGEENE